MSNAAETDPATSAAPAPDYAAMSLIMRLACEIALGAFVRGVREVPSGSNHGPEVDTYLIGRRGDGVAMLCGLTYAGKPCPNCGGKRPVPACKGSAWCARFALWCFEGAAAQLGRPAPTAGAGGLASAIKWRDWAKASGRWRTDPAPGRIGILIDERQHGHVVIVLRLDPSGGVVSLEGNHHDRVDVVQRAPALFSGFVDLS